MKIYIDKKYFRNQAVMTAILLAVMVGIPLIFFSNIDTPYLEDSTSFLMLVAVSVVTSTIFAFLKGAIKFSSRHDNSN